MMKNVVTMLTLSVYLTGVTVGQDNWHFTGENIALRKNAIQFPDTTDQRMKAGKAVDGNTSNYFTSEIEGSCSHTKKSENAIAFWTVLLNGVFVIKGVQIYNREPHHSRLNRFQVLGGEYLGDVLYDDAGASTKLYNETVISIPISSTTPYTKLTIKVPPGNGIYNFDQGLSYMILCEVEVYAAMQGCILTNNASWTWMIRGGTEHYNATYGLVSVNADIYFRCNEWNFKLSHTNDVRCLANGSYDGHFPECREIICPTPLAIFGGSYTHMTKEKYTLNDMTSFQCDDGYLPRHLQTRTCLESSAWGGSEYECNLVTCTYPIEFSDGMLFYKSGIQFSNGLASAKTELNIACDEGFSSESTITQCTYDTTWDPIPHCSVIKCNSIGDLPGGFYSYNQPPIDGTISYAYGTIAQPNCSSNVYKVGGVNSTRVCGLSGNWIGNETICGPALNEPQISSPSDPPLSAGVVGGMIAGVVILISATIVLGVILFFRRKRNVKKEKRLQSEATGQSLDTKFDSTLVNMHEQQIVDSNDPGNYYSFGDFQRVSKTSIQLTDLANFVINMDSNKFILAKQFEKLPYGLKKTCNAAVGAKGKNRYRNLYAYDDTRVVLDVWNKKTESDYINACYVHGLHKTKAYIASQGPTQDMIDDFWRMIWQKNCEKIVMLTNLNEHGKMKSEKYWPDSGTKKYGSISVKMIKENTFSNFVIRTLNISKIKEESKTITQFHFTSWPDKDVPLFCSSLVHFHHKVKEEMKPDEAPIVVHCSAGIGRTGTFIAIDFLYDQARELGYIDVLGCVESLRQQRVNLVQTRSQYIYVHQALTELFSLKTSVISSANFEEHYNDLIKRPNDGEPRTLDKEFELLGKMSVSCEDDKTPEQKENAPKVEDFMPSLSQQGLFLFGEYIDASFLPIYKEDSALIIARSPTEKTCEDFWKLIYHQNVHTVVMMDNKSQLQSEQIYWPDKVQEVHFGAIKIHRNSVSKTNGHQIIIMTLSKNKTDRRIQLIQYCGWKTGNAIPDNAYSILSALDCVEEYQRQTGNHPVLVHCMGGAEKSGLFCVVDSLLDRTKIEQDVAISQVIQEIRSRRRGVIPNVDQFQFCHEVILAFLQRHETYANFVVNE